MNNNTRKIVIKILYILLIVAIISLIAIVLVDLGIFKKEPKKDNKVNTEKEIIKVKQNQNQKIKEKHCFKNLCLEEMTISYNPKYDSGEIEFVFRNNSTEAIPEGFVKIIDKDDEQIKFVTAHDRIEAGNTQKYVIETTNKNIINMKDYTLSELTEEEIQFQNNHQKDI